MGRLSASDWRHEWTLVSSTSGCILCATTLGTANRSHPLQLAHFDFARSLFLTTTVLLVSHVDDMGQCRLDETGTRVSCMRAEGWDG